MVALKKIPYPRCLDPGSRKFFHGEEAS